MVAVAPIAVMASGLVCGLGLTAAESCAAIRCGLNNFQETRFIGSGGDWIVGSEARRRVSSVIAPVASCGALRSTRTSARLPRTSMSRTVAFSTTASPR